MLLLFDCCYSASAAFGPATESHEIIASSAMESDAAANLNTFFTRHLITLLNECLSQGNSVAEMNAIMVRDATIT